MHVDRSRLSSENEKKCRSFCLYAMLAVDPAPPGSPTESQKSTSSKAFGLPFLDGSRVGLTIRRRRRRASECPTVLDSPVDHECTAVRNPKRSYSLRLSKPRESKSVPISQPTSPSLSRYAAPNSSEGDGEPLRLAKARKALHSIVGMATHARKSLAWLARATGNEETHLSVDAARLAQSVRIRRASCPNQDEAGRSRSPSSDRGPDSCAEGGEDVVRLSPLTQLSPSPGSQKDGRLSSSTKRSPLTTVLSNDDGCQLLTRQSEPTFNTAIRPKLKHGQTMSHGVSYDSIGTCGYDAHLDTPASPRSIQIIEPNQVFLSRKCGGAPNCPAQGYDDCETASVASSIGGENRSVSSLKPSSTHKRGITVLVKRARTRDRSHLRERSHSQSPPSERFLEMCKEFDNLLAPVRGSRKSMSEIDFCYMPKPSKSTSNVSIVRTSDPRTQEKPAKPKRSNHSPSRSHQSLALNPESPVFSDGSVSNHSLGHELAGDGDDSAFDKPPKPQRLFNSWRQRPKRESSKKPRKSVESTSDQASCHSLVSGYSIESSLMNVQLDSPVKDASGEGEVETGVRASETAPAIMTNSLVSGYSIKSSHMNVQLDCPVKDASGEEDVETGVRASETAPAIMTRYVEATDSLLEKTKTISTDTITLQDGTQPLVDDIPEPLPEEQGADTTTSTETVTSLETTEPLVKEEKTLPISPEALVCVVETLPFPGGDVPEPSSKEEETVRISEEIAKETKKVLTTPQDSTVSRTQSWRRNLSGSKKFPQRKASVRISKYVEKFEGSVSSSPPAEMTPLVQSNKRSVGASSKSDIDVQCSDSTNTHVELSRQESTDSLDMSSVMWKENADAGTRKAPRRTIAIRQNADSFDQGDKALGIVGQEELMRRWSTRRNKLRQSKVTSRIIESYEQRETDMLVRKGSIKSNIGSVGSRRNSDAPNPPNEVCGSQTSSIDELV